MNLGTWHFALFSLVAILLYRACSTFKQRQVCLLFFNTAFLLVALQNLFSLLVLFGFLLLSFCAARWRTKKAENWPTFATVVFIAGCWFFLFCVRDHAFAPGLNPFARTAILIVGISYMVFRSISYFFDFEVIERPDFLSYFNYVLFFPSILAGPIARYEPFIASVETPLPLSAQDFLSAAHRIVNGMLKKFVLADSLNILLPTVQNLRTMPTPQLWFGTLLNLFVLYLDFSGYCDICIGLARIMGCSLPENFDNPFMARNVQEFWNRWHMSLSTVIRDYFFMPITKQMYRVFAKTNRILLVTFVYAFCMILIALWHGTTQGYLLYGILHASGLIGIQLWRRLQKRGAVMSFKSAGPGQSNWRDWGARVATYAFVSMTVTLSDFSGVDLSVLIHRLAGF